MTKPLPTIFLLALIAAVSACGGDSSPEERIANAKTYLQQTNYEAAVIELKNVLQQDKDSAEARWLLGKVYLDTGYPQSAQKELELAQRLSWAAEDVTPSLAKAYLALNELVKIRELSDEGLSAAAQGELMSVQALAEHSQGETDAATLLIAKAVELAPQSADVQLAQARLLAAQQETDGTLEVLNSLLANHPEHGQAWTLKGDVLAFVKRPEEAIVAYSGAIEAQPKNFTARQRRALLLLQLGKVDEAQADVDALTELSPNEPSGNYVQGMIHFSNKRYPESIASLSLAEPAFRQHPMVLFYLGSAHLLEGNAGQASAFAERFVTVMPDNIAGRKLLATLSLHRGDFDDVVALLQPVLDHNPDDVDALNLMSNALIRTGKTDEGINMLSRVAELRPDSPQAQVRLGAGLLLSGERAEAATHIESALELNPEFQQADILLVLNHVRNQDFDLAIEAAKAFVGRDPGSVTPYNLLGRVYLAADKKQEARESFANALKIDPGDPGANNNLAELALKAGDDKAARTYYDTVLEYHPNLLSTLMHLARLEAAQRNREELLTVLDRAMTAHPTAVEPRLLVGQYYLNTGKAEQVAPLFATLEPVQQQSPPVLQLMAMAYLSTGEYEQATQALTQLLEKSPDNATLHHLMARAAVGSGDTATAREELQRTLELEPEHFPSLLALTRMDLLAGSTDAYTQGLAKLAKMAPENPDVLTLQAAATYHKQDPKSAAQLARKAHQIAPSEQSLIRLCGYLEADGRRDEAIQLEQQWLAENPDSPAVRLALGITLGQAGKSSESREHYAQLLADNPDNFEALNNMAWELREADTPQALEYAKRAVELQPENAAGLDTLSVVEYYNEDYPAALRSIRRAMSQAPGVPSQEYHNAMIEAARGEVLTARQALETLLAKTTDFPEYQDAKALLASLK